ncbi:hypothetical protein ACRWQN_05335 [Shewanella sp. HL-SH8]|uniref:hypothetical protein n=1 Tax=Shewanella sp. HL-SH8 TaxID=3436242 RepID=UPI003EB6970B
MFKPLRYAILSTCLSNIAFASELPAILDYLPKCEPIILSEYHQQLTFINDENDDVTTKLNADDFREQSIKNALLVAQQNGKKSGAEAIIIEQLFTLDFVKKVAGNSDEDKYDNYKINVNIEAKNITLCDNKELTTKRTPFGSNGMRVLLSDTSVVLAVPNSQSLMISADKHKPPSASVSVNGAYGVMLGDPLSILKAQMGPESIRLLDHDGTQILGYGRSLWFYVKSNKVIGIAKNEAILNSHGTNLIAFSENYDIDNWFINDVNYRDTYQSVNQNLDLVQHGDETIVYSDTSQLFLNFESFKVDLYKDAELLLNGFTILPSGDKKKSANINFTATDSIEVSHFFTMNTEDMYQLDDQQRSNQVNLNADGVWVIANENLLFGVNDKGIVNRIRVTESIIKEQSKQDFNLVLARYNIPVLKSDLLKLYPNAEDNFDSVMVTKGTKLLFATFDSDEDNAQLIDIMIEL